MKKLKLASVAALALCSVHAMPTKQEIADTRALVAELMAPTMADYKAKAKTVVEVADISVGFAKSAKSEAAQFLFLRGAASYYAKGGDFGKAADTIEELKAKVSNVPPSEIVSIISGSLSRENVRKSPRLQSMLSLAQAQMKASKDLPRLSMQLKKISTAPVRRQYAEAMALSSDWKAALAEFSKVDGEIGKMAKVEADGSAGNVELGDFWWGYETSYAGAEGFFREHAAGYYRKTIAEGKVDGLKKTLVEQRLASLALSDVDDSEQSPVAASTAGAQTAAAQQKNGLRARTTVKDPSGLVHRWSFTDGFADSVGSVAPAKYGSAKAENGFVTLQSGSPLEFPAGTVPLAPFTIQVWASATEKAHGAGNDFIFKIASSPDSSKDSVFWRWTGSKKWFSSIGGFGKEHNCYKENSYILNGKPHLHTLTVEKDGKGMLLKFYQDDTLFGTIKTEFAWKKPPMLVLGGLVTSTYDEVRIYSRALAHLEVINSLNLGPDKLPEAGKK